MSILVAELGFKFLDGWFLEHHHNYLCQLVSWGTDIWILGSDSALKFWHLHFQLDSPALLLQVIQVLCIQNCMSNWCWAAQVRKSRSMFSKHYYSSIQEHVDKKPGFYTTATESKLKKDLVQTLSSLSMMGILNHAADGKPPTRVFLPVVSNA